MRFALLISLAATPALFALTACSSRDSGPEDLGPDAGALDGALPDLAVDSGGDVDAGGGTDAGIDGGPDCTGLTLCTTSGVTCDGNTRVICGRNPAGCLIENRTDCTTVASGTCSTMGGAHCTVDMCVGFSTCPTAGRTCMGDMLVTCAADSIGCLVTTTVDCTSVGATCLPMPPDGDGGIGPAACSASAPCFGIDPSTFCTTEGRTCPTTTQLADCHMNATGCLVETDTTCTGSPLAHCDDTIATPACVDPCAGLTLCADSDPAARCVGARIVTCARDTAGCYVRTESNCGTMGMGCDASSGTPVCSGVLCPAMAGTLSCTGRVLPYSQSGDTSTESNVLPRNSCAAGTTYLGHEGIWTFTSDVAAVAHVMAHPISDTTHGYDLLVLDGTSSPCDTSSTCATSDTGFGSGGRSVDFSVLPGERYYVVYDGTDATATTTYSLFVTCDLCGDGVVSPPERCDDGNLAVGDGCSALCLPEIGWACDGASPSNCHRTICGNGFVEPGETCDDHNTTAGDGCSPTCQAEVFTSLAAPGGVITVMGMLSASDPTYARPDGDCVDPGFDIGAYDIWVVENTTTSTVTLTVDASWGFGDGFLAAYSPPFDPTMPSLDCVTADDDFGSTDFSQLTGIVVAPGAQVIIVATEFDSGSAIGPYTLMFTSM